MLTMLSPSRAVVVNLDSSELVKFRSHDQGVSTVDNLCLEVAERTHKADPIALAGTVFTSYRK